MRAVAPLVGGPAAQRRYTAELIDVFVDLIRDPVCTAAARYELALLDGGELAPIEDFLVAVEDGASRDLARRRILRAAAISGVGSVAEAVAAGFSTDEDSPGSLLALGICARRQGDLGLAQRSLECATHLWSSAMGGLTSPFAAVMAKFHLAGVLADQGQVDRSRALYETFLGHWENADRQVPEVAVAGQVLRCSTGEHHEAHPRGRPVGAVEADLAGDRR